MATVAKYAAIAISVAAALPSGGSSLSLLATGLGVSQLAAQGIAAPDTIGCGFAECPF